MKLQRFALISTLCAAPFLLTACNKAQVIAPVSAAPISNEVHQLKNGLRVEVMPIENDDLAQLLDAKMWKFRVSSNDSTNRMLVSSVKVLQHGKVVKSVGGFGVDPFTGKTADVSVAMMPLHGSWSKARILKINMRMKGNSGSNTFANPFTTSQTLLTGSQFDGDAILLMASSGKQRNVSGAARVSPVSLILIFTTRPIKRQPQ